MKHISWVRLLTYITGLVNQELLLQNDYLAAENRILRARLPGRLRPSDAERTTLAEIGKRLGRKALANVACVAKPDTILAWYRRLVAQKFDGSKRRTYPGRPRIDPKLEALIIRMAQENSGWGYDRIVGALANLGYQVSEPNRRKCTRTSRPCSSTQAKPKHHLEGIHSTPHGRDGRHRFLHGRSADVARPGDLLHPFLYSPGEPAGLPGRNYSASGPSLDGADGPQRDRRELGISGSAALRPARSGCEVLRVVPGHTGVGRDQTYSTARAKPELERLRRTLGTICERGMPAKADPVRGRFAPPRAGRLQRP